MRQKITISLCVVGLALKLAGAVAPVERSDEQIHSVLRSKLDRNFFNAAADISIRVKDQVITLDGQVSSLPEKRRAEKIASTLRGVKGVRNRISVRASDKPDSEVARQIREAFAAEPAIDPAEVRLEVKRGAVTLNGTVDSFAEKWIAGRVAANVAGVRALSNDITIEYVEERPDSEILADIKARLAWDAKVEGGRIRPRIRDGYVTLSGSVNSPVEKMWVKFDSWVAGVKGVDATGVLVRNLAPGGEKGEEVQMTDLAIRQAVDNSFLYHPELSMAPKVAVDSRIVTLTGKVDTLRTERLAAQVASEIAGVRQVRNKLRVTPGSGGKGDLPRSVAAAFKRDPYVEKEEIYIVERDGEISLTGFVDSEFERERAKQVAEGVAGVRSVTDELQISETNPIYYWQSAKGSKQAREADSELQEDVREEFAWSPYVQDDDVSLWVRNGVVTLTGSVPSVFARIKAEENAYEAGAARVVNRLVVRPKTTREMYLVGYSPEMETLPSRHERADEK